MPNTSIVKACIMCLVFLATMSFMPKQSSAMVAQGVVFRSPPFSTCMQGETHYLANPCDGSIVVHLKRYLNLDSYIGEYVRVTGPEVGVECAIINVEDIMVLPTPECCKCDLNHDCRCDMQDWLLFGKEWGRTNCP